MLERELQKFGLTEKQTKVYLAALELGVSTIQELSKHSGINRATTYIQVEVLISKGLINMVEQGKKTVIVAEKPQRLLEILEQKKNKVEILENKMQKLMPDLEAIFNVKSTRPRVRFLDTPAGFEFFQEEMKRARPEVLYTLIPQSEVPDEVFDKIVEKVKQVKILFALSENIKNTFNKYSNVEARFFQIKDYHMEITLYNNKILINKRNCNNYNNKC